MEPIEIDMSSPEHSRIEDEESQRKKKKEEEEKNQQAFCGIVFCVFLIGCLFLALGAYYQITHCNKFQEWPNVECNTTHFRMDNIPYVGVKGYATVTYLNGKCQSPEFQVFECTNMNKLANCVAVNQLNYDSGKPWPCYLPTMECDPNGAPPQLDGPSLKSTTEWKLRTAFFVIGGYFAGAVVLSVLCGVLGAMWSFLCQNTNSSSS